METKIKVFEGTVKIGKDAKYLKRHLEPQKSEIKEALKYIGLNLKTGELVATDGHSLLIYQAEISGKKLTDYDSRIPEAFKNFGDKTNNIPDVYMFDAKTFELMCGKETDLYIEIDLKGKLGEIEYYDDSLNKRTKRKVNIPVVRIETEIDGKASINAYTMEMRYPNYQAVIPEPTYQVGMNKAVFEKVCAFYSAHKKDIITFSVEHTGGNRLQLNAEYIYAEYKDIIQDEEDIPISFTEVIEDSSIICLKEDFDMKKGGVFYEDKHFLLGFNRKYFLDFKGIFTDKAKFYLTGRYSIRIDFGTNYKIGLLMETALTGSYGNDTYIYIYKYGNNRTIK